MYALLFPLRPVPGWPVSLFVAVALTTSCAGDRAAERTAKKPPALRSPAALTDAEQRDALAMLALLHDDASEPDEDTRAAADRAFSRLIRAAHPDPNRLDVTPRERLLAHRDVRRALLRLVIAHDLDAAPGALRSTEPFVAPLPAEGPPTDDERRELLDHARDLVRTTGVSPGRALRLAVLRDKAVEAERARAGSSAKGPPTDEEVRAALFGAALALGDADRALAHTSSPCLDAQRALKSILKAIYIAQEGHRGEHDTYVDELGRLDIGHPAKVPYTITITAAPDDGNLETSFLATAVGRTGTAVEGDRWTIDHRHDVVHAGVECPVPSAPPPEVFAPLLSPSEAGTLAAWLRTDENPDDRTQNDDGRALWARVIGAFAPADGRADGRGWVDDVAAATWTYLRDHTDDPGALARAIKRHLPLGDATALTPAEEREVVRLAQRFLAGARLTDAQGLRLAALGDALVEGPSAFALGADDRREVETWQALHKLVQRHDPTGEAAFLAAVRAARCAEARRTVRSFLWQLTAPAEELHQGLRESRALLLDKLGKPIEHTGYTIRRLGDEHAPHRYEATGFGVFAGDRVVVAGDQEVTVTASVCPDDEP